VPVVVIGHPDYEVLLDPDRQVTELEARGIESLDETDQQGPRWDGRVAGGVAWSE